MSLSEVNIEREVEVNLNLKVRQSINFNEQDTNYKVMPKWKKMLSRNYQQHYWFNTITGESTWCKPEQEPELEPQPEDDKKIHREETIKEINEKTTSEKTTNTKTNKKRPSKVRIDEDETKPEQSHRTSEDDKKIHREETIKEINEKTTREKTTNTKTNKKRPSKLRIIDEDETKPEQSYLISEQQIKAVKEIVEEFEQRRRWIILTAQMQSGKTTTYYLTATVMLMKRLVNKVIIFSGNTEYELKNQINEDKNKLIGHLIRNPTALDTFGNNMNIYELTHYIDKNLIVLWGHDMKKYEVHSSTDKVLYIWDESHAAQDKINMPAKFLKDVEISACGYQDNLEEQNSYMLSVSATPFSEISDNKHEEQTKSIVNLEVDNNSYHGVKKMIEKELIKSYRYEDWKEHLTRTLNHHKRQEPKYALIRLRENKTISTDELVRIITDEGWNYLTFDSSKDSDVKGMERLERQPTMHTVVILKGKCRMGKVVPKQFIAFCMETAKKSNTDVILQGLLGRMCGYPKHGNPIYEVEIHLSHYIFKKNSNGMTEFGRYMQYIKSNDTIPRRAKNILQGDVRTISKFYPIIPIKIRFEHLDNYRENTIRTNVRDLFNRNINSHNFNISDYNNDVQKQELFERFYTIDDKIIKVRYIDNENTYIQADIPNRIHHLINSRKHERVHLSYSGTKKKDELNEEIILWVFKKSFEEYGIMQGDIFVDAETCRTTREHIRETEETIKMPLTTKKEIFCKSDSNDEINYRQTQNETDCETDYETDYETDCTINGLDSDDEF
jgi:hypothetical protein